MLPDLTALEETPLIKLGNISLTLGGVITGAVTIGVALVLAWAVTRGIRRLRVRARRATGALYLLEKLAGYGIIVAGVFFGLSAAGLNLSSLAVFAGAIGIGIGLGLQGVVKEFVSGLFIIFDGMVSVGDYVELEGVRGVIAEIGPRATRIRNNDNIDVIVPNSKLIEGTVTNWTLKGDTRRIHIPFGVAYESDRAAVREAVLAAARASPFTLPETETRKCQVWLTGFGDSSLNFELLVWPTLDAVKRPAAMHAAYTWAIADALDGAGIEIPFPQTDLRVRSVFGHAGDDGLEAMGLKRPRPAPRPAAAAGPTANDAAEELSHPVENLAPETDDPEGSDPA
ncbi:mechanosensitive ion channel domain-containing protein [uncultured Brevundimonas sp.]|uniref:mechanosensitive ion channel family protein n=1 Tax=uncultured Brevundimonas sp. TaxID=213418 RepID=UPI0030ED727E|tara:strand:- start:4813 stop:5835 length:1023 start_codon:yes stop_codon:yes gene_type:complete